MSRSHVKGHRRGGVCVLRMLLAFYFSQCSKQPFSDNRVKIGAYVLLEFCSQAFRHRDTHTQTNCNENITLSTISWRFKNRSDVIAKPFCMKFLYNQLDLSSIISTILNQYPTRIQPDTSRKRVTDTHTVR